MNTDGAPRQAVRPSLQAHGTSGQAHGTPAPETGRDTTALEAAYARALYAYPGSWRREQGAEMIGVLLDVARSEHRTHPTPAELINLVGNGLAARALALLGAVGRTRRNGIAFTATVLATYLALALTLLGEWGPWVRPGTLRWRPTGEGFGESLLPLGPFTTAAAVVYLALIAGFLATLAGRRALRRTLYLSTAAAAPLVSLAGTWMEVLAPPLVPMLGVSALALLALAGNPATTTSGRLLLAVVTAGVSWGGVMLAVSRLPGGAALFFYDADSLIAVDARSLTLAAVFLMLLAGMLLASGRRALPWTVGLAVAAVPLLVRLWSGGLLDGGLLDGAVLDGALTGSGLPADAGWGGGFLLLAPVAAAALTAVGLRLGSIGSRRRQGLPRTT
ncbi:hypothetical protein LJ756_06370 [Arthrobacter sp. zg-Y411]|uniref:hypothetical protein n=1 Tax=Arthrobacter zhangbolii TaxID=2886936 RepID=UPI001D14E239|nr:hypothetical protein [Arthrobacter zhangbolii]MCC3294245.1 hypothetical protein [Arthrobacter zhangbolii]